MRKPKFFLIFILFLVFSFFFLPLTTHHLPLTNEVHAALSCDACHKGPPTGPDYASAVNRRNSHAKHTASLGCEICHIVVTTGAPAAAGYTIAFATNHVKGYYAPEAKPPETFTYTYAATGSSCTSISCHDNTYWGGPALGCKGCHTSARGTVVPRRAIVAEFASGWSHGKSSSQTAKVTDRDCSVCHMEGKSAADPTTTALHMNSVINLRDPDTGWNIYWSSWSAATNDHFTPAAASTFTFVKFPTVYNSTGMLTDYGTMKSTFTAVQINFCLKCHDTNGANSPLARVRSWDRPFDSTGTLATNSSGTASALGNLFLQFSAANASYHPVRGRGNNNFCSTVTLHAPWGVTGKFTNRMSTWNFVAGSLISCWDCHIQTATAHGGSATLRDAYPRTAAAVTPLCTQCHQSGIYWGATWAVMRTSASAFAVGWSGSAACTDAHPSAAAGRHLPTDTSFVGCVGCHGSNEVTDWKTAQGRRLQAEDAHGHDVIRSTWTAWASGASVKAFAFLRRSNPTIATGSRSFDNWCPRSPSGTIGATTLPGKCIADCGGATRPGHQALASEGYEPGGRY